MYDIPFREIFFPVDRVRSFHCQCDQANTFTQGSVLGTGTYKTLLGEKDFEITAPYDGICIHTHDPIDSTNYNDSKAGESTTAITYIELNRWDYFSSKLKEHEEKLYALSRNKIDKKNVLEMLHYLDAMHQQIFSEETDHPEQFAQIYTEFRRGTLQKIDALVTYLLSVLGDDTSHYWRHPYVMELWENIPQIYAVFLEIYNQHESSSETRETLLAEEKALDAEYEALQQKQSQTITPHPSKKPFAFLLDSFLKQASPLFENSQSVTIEKTILNLHQRMQMLLEDHIPILLEDIEGVRPHFFHINALERNFALYDEKMQTVMNSEFLEAIEKQKRIEEWRDRRHKDMLSVF